MANTYDSLEVHRNSVEGAAAALRLAAQGMGADAPSQYSAHTFAQALEAYLDAERNYNEALFTEIQRLRKLEGPPQSP